MQVSIAMATYNGEKYIEEQLHSFLVQTHLPDELIICDDRSSDETIAIAHRFAEFAPFMVKIIVNERTHGYAQNFSKALMQCGGDIVFMSDQDDVWHEKKIEKMLERFVDEPLLQLLIHDLDYCKADLTRIGQTKIERMEGIFNIQRDYVVGMATAIRGPFLRLCLPVPDEINIAHDNWLHECAGSVNRKSVMREVLALYRRHASNATVTNSLNVDFFTLPSHFKVGKKSSLILLNKKTSLNSSRKVPIIEWLQNNKLTLADRGYGTLDRIQHEINVLTSENEFINFRIRVLGLSRSRRLLPVMRLYFTGGYNQFSGWRSALKDLLLN